MTSRFSRSGDQLLDVDDLADLLGLTKRAVYNRRYRPDGLPPHIKLGRSLRWRQEDVDGWLLAHRVSSDQPESLS